MPYDNDSDDGWGEVVTPPAAKPAQSAFPMPVKPQARQEEKLVEKPPMNEVSLMPDSPPQMESIKKEIKQENPPKVDSNVPVVTVDAAPTSKNSMRTFARTSVNGIARFDQAEDSTFDMDDDTIDQGRQSPPPKGNGVVIQQTAEVTEKPQDNDTSYESDDGWGKNTFSRQPAKPVIAVARPEADPDIQVINHVVKKSEEPAESLKPTGFGGMSKDTGGSTKSVQAPVKTIKLPPHSSPVKQPATVVKVPVTNNRPTSPCTITEDESDGWSDIEDTKPVERNPNANESFAPTFGKQQSFDFQKGPSIESASQKSTGFGGPPVTQPERKSDDASSMKKGQSTTQAPTFPEPSLKPMGFGESKQFGGTKSFGQPKNEESQQKTFGQSAPENKSSFENSTPFGQSNGATFGTKSSGFVQKTDGFDEKPINDQAIWTVDGSTSSHQTSGFGQQTSGFKQPSQQSSFGGSKQSTGFGQSGQQSGFGESKIKQETSGFGKSRQQSGFGDAKQSQQQSAFGQSRQQSEFDSPKPQITTGFGQPSQQSGFGQSNSGFGQTNSGFGQTNSGFGQTNSGFGGKNEENSSGFAPKSTAFGENRNEGNRNTSSFGGARFGQSNNAGFGGYGKTNESSFGEASTFDQKPTFGFGNDGQVDTGFGEGGGYDGGFERRPRGGCFNCGQEGHNSSDCTEPRKPQTCFNCRQEGHQSNECTEPRKPQTCFNCRQEGHQSKDCPEPPRPRGACYNCNEEGHSSRDCPQERKPRPCNNCKEEGHHWRECPKERVPATETCTRCNDGIHWSSDCPTRPRDLEGNVLLPYDVQFPLDEELFVNSIENRNMDYDQKIIATMSGLKIPDLPTFEHFKQLTEQMQSNLKLMKMHRPTPIQKAAFLQVLTGNDLVACAHTGCGKTLAFLLPLVVNLQNDLPQDNHIEYPIAPRCVIICPTRELASQTYHTSRQIAYKTGVTTGIAYGGYSRNTNLQNLKGKGPLSILVCTMGRLADYIGAGEISLEKLKYLVLDEADRMVNIKDFGEEINKIIAAPDDRNFQTLLFSASFDNELQAGDLKTFMKKDYTMLEVDKFGTANQQIEQTVLETDRNEKNDKLFEILGIDNQNFSVRDDSPAITERTLIFVNNVKFCDVLATKLSHASVSVITMHSYHNQETRDRTLNSFNNGEYNVMIASNVCARGLNITNLDHVINYDMPHGDTFDEYVNRIGRTGRAGFSGKSTTFFSSEDNQDIAPKLITVLEEAEKEVPEFLRNCVGNGFENGAAGGDDEDW